MRSRRAEPTRGIEVLGGLAAGRVSMVSLARHRNHLIAVKRPHPGLAGDADANRAFHREMFLQSAIDHEGTVPIEDVWEDDAGPLAALRYVDGPSLARLQRVLDGGSGVLTRLSVPVAVRVMLDLLHALDGLAGRLNRQGLVHGDLSPGNILLSQDGRAWLTDFGTACQEGERQAPPIFDAGPVLGYAAPEALQHEPVDARSDVFGAGILFWEMCAGTRLFAAPNRDALALRMAHAVPDLRPFAPMLPEEAIRVCEKALARAPEDRFPSARAFSDALEAAMKTGFGVPRQEAVAATVRSRCANLIAQRNQLIAGPADALQSGIRPARRRSGGDQG